MKHTAFRSAYPATFTGSALTPEMVLSFHRLTFGDARMAEGDPDPKPEPKPEPQGDPDGLGEAGKKALAAERSARADAEKKAKDLEAKVAEFETSKLTEQQRIEKERDDAKSDRDSKATLLARYEAAEAAGIPLSWAKRLVGTTVEELKADAESVKADIGNKGGSTPAPDRSQGGTGSGSDKGGSVSTGRDLFAESRSRK